MMCMQLSVTYCVICLDLRNPILQGLAMKLPGQWFIFLHNICFTFLVSLNVCRWLFACTCFSPRLIPPLPPLLQRALLFGRTGEENTEPRQNVAFVVCVSCAPPPLPGETEQRRASGSSGHFGDTALNPSLSRRASHGLCDSG